MNIGDLIRTQARLTQLQLELTNLIEKTKLEDLRLIDIDCEPRYEIVNGVLKLIIPEYAPRINVLHKVEIVDGNIINGVYQEVRNRWYSLIHKALENYEGGRIDPSIVYIVYYVPWVCDVSNFVGKMIIDGLMYTGVIGIDDNLKHVPVEIQEIKLDQENPRTEIYIIEYKNQLEKILLPWINIKKYENRVEELKKEIEKLEEIRNKREREFREMGRVNL